MAKTICFVLLFASLIAGFAQTGEITWTVKDSVDLLVGATIQVADQVLVTDVQGQAVARLSPGAYVYRISFVGFETLVDSVAVFSGNKSIEITMSSATGEMSEVIVSDQRLEELITQTSGGFTRFGMEGSSDLPYLLGEQDPLKFIQTQPGVTSGTDGNNGYYVRGGGIDQNKIELDHMELYNANHLLGFFSMFNASAVSSADYYKSGIEASQGSRLSSIMRINTRTPDAESVTGDIGLGFLAARLTLNLPVIKSRSAFMVSARRSYIDLITQNLFRKESTIRNTTDYKFNDLILKYHHQVNRRHSLTLTGFSGSDDYHFSNRNVFENSIRWATYNGGLTWKWLITPTSDAEFYFTAGSYDQTFGAEISTYNLNLNSKIRDWRHGIIIYHTLPGHTLSYGYDWIFRKLQPNEVDLTSGDQDFTLTESSFIHGLEGALFVDDQLPLNDRVQLGLGLRISGFAQLGPFTRYETDDGSIILDTLTYGRAEPVKTYLNPEPRIRINYLLSEDKSIKASYDRTYQYIHLSPLSSVSLPTDIWVPSSRQIKPQSAHQFSFGYYRILKEKELSYSVSAYFKSMKNQVEYKSGTIIGYSLGYNFDDLFIFGKGRSAGIEFLIQKEKGRTQFQAGYTLSRSVKSFPEINRGEFFPAKYDRTHDLNLIVSHRLPGWTFSGLFKLATGSALTLPVARYFIEGKVVSEYLERNSLRMPLYHRLDLAATWTPSRSPQSSWTFSVFNTYNRKNPFYIFFDVTGDITSYSLDINLKQVSLFPVLPSVSYEWKF